MRTFTMHDTIVYSKERDGSINLTTNFRVKEFACSDGTDPILIHPFLPFICQSVRNKFGVAFTPNSAYRTVCHNEKVGGVSNSNHIYGLAVDIPAVGGVTPQQLYDYVDELLGDCGELGIYEWGIHVGVQDTKVRFKG